MYWRTPEGKKRRGGSEQSLVKNIVNKPGQYLLDIKGKNGEKAEEAYIYEGKVARSGERIKKKKEDVQ